jgi:hypothetical protein
MWLEITANKRKTVMTSGGIMADGALPESTHLQLDGGDNFHFAIIVVVTAFSRHDTIPRDKRLAGIAPGGVK